MRHCAHAIFSLVIYCLLVPQRRYDPGLLLFFSAEFSLSRRHNRNLVIWDPRRIVPQTVLAVTSGTSTLAYIAYLWISAFLASHVRHFTLTKVKSDEKKTINATLLTTKSKYKYA